MTICPSCQYQNLYEHVYCTMCGQSLIPKTGKLMPNTVLEGRYVIVKTLGRGGMGAVYQATDRRLAHIPVAIKEMSAIALGFGNLQKAIESFKKEATMLVSLRHQALPRVTDFFSQGSSRWYLVMDYIEGHTLKHIAEKRSPIPYPEVLDWAAQICKILDYLHSRRPPVIFRDLKPSNIMLTNKRRIKLIDFGIARHFKPDLKSDTSAYGSTGFAPPEQYGGNQTDKRSDIYALGATLHYLLTGVEPQNHPFKFEPPGKYVTVPPALEEVIMKALKLEPENRPGDVREMLAVIEQNPAEPVIKIGYSSPASELSGSPEKCSEQETFTIIEKKTVKEIELDELTETLKLENSTKVQDSREDKDAGINRAQEVPLHGWRPLGVVIPDKADDKEPLEADHKAPRGFVWKRLNE